MTLKNLFLHFIFVSILILQPLLTIAEINPTFQTLGDSLKVLVSKAKLDEAELLLPKLDSLAQIYNSPETKADLFYYKAYFWLFKKGEVKSLELLTKAAVKYNELGLQKKVNIVESRICVNLYFLGRYDACVEKGESLLKTIPLKEQDARGWIHNILGALYGGQGPEGDQQKCFYHTTMAIPYFKKENNNRRLLSLYGILAAFHNTKGDYKKALIYIDSSSNCAKKLGNLRQVNFLKIRKSRALSNMGQDEKALKLLIEAEEYYGKHGSEHGELNWIIGLQMIHHEKMGDYKKAYNFLNLRDSIGKIESDRENEKATNNLMVKYETEKKEQQIKIQALEIDFEKERNQRLTFGALGGLSFLLLLFGGAYFYYRQKQQEKLRRAEINYQKQLLETTVETQEQERKRIARDLHDGIGQQMSGLKMGFQQLVENIEQAVPEQVGLMTKLNSIIHDASTDVRDLSHQMMPKALQEFGLIPGLEDMLDKSLASAGLKYEFEHFGITDRLSENIEIGLYRISQELINNILKHADASEVDIQLMKQSNQLLLIVEDNGKGFDLNTTSQQGHGMMNIQSRLQAIGGVINFECPDSGGTIATVRIS